MIILFLPLFLIPVKTGNPLSVGDDAANVSVDMHEEDMDSENEVTEDEGMDDKIEEVRGAEPIKGHSSVHFPQSRNRANPNLTVKPC